LGCTELDELLGIVGDERTLLLIGIYIINAINQIKPTHISRFRGCHPVGPVGTSQVRYPAKNGVHLKDKTITTSKNMDIYQPRMRGLISYIILI